LIRWISRLTIVLLAVVIFSAILPGCGGPSVSGPYTLDEAKNREKAGKLEEALQLYHAVVRENQHSNPPIAAKALYEGGLFAQDEKRYGTTEARKHAGEAEAVRMWRQLRDEWNSLRASEVLSRQDLVAKYEGVTTRIDQRNRRDWKYQIIDSLVKLTGGKSYSYGIALILLALLVKLILFPLTRRQYASQREMQRMQPLLKELQAKFKGVELNQKQMQLYKEHGVNPFAGCFLALVQLPFLILIFTAVQSYEIRFSDGNFLWIGSGLAAQFPQFLGTNLAMPDVPLLAIYVLTNYITMRLSPAADPQQQQQMNSMALMTSIFFFWMFLSSKWSSAFVLYWLAQNMISIWQQYHYIYQPHKSGRGGASSQGPSTSGGNGAGSPIADAAPIAEVKPQARARARKKKK
jgi:YidC/Oxa1 family membrane protein insertase